MRLLTNPSSLDDGGEHAQAHLGGQVGKIVFLLSRRAVFADFPDASSNKMVQLIIVTRRKTLCHWLNALIGVAHVARQNVDALVPRDRTHLEN